MSEKTETKNEHIVDMSTPLTVFNATEAAIQKLKDDYLNLTIAGVDDKDGYKAVSEGLRIIVGLRNKIDKRRLDIKRNIDSSAKTILADLEPIENALRLQKDGIDQEVARRKQEAEAAELLKFNNRTSGLFALGFRFDGNAYVLGTLSLTPGNIKLMSDAVFAGYINQGTEIAKKLQEEKEAEAARLAAIEAKEKELAEREAKLAAQAPKAPNTNTEVRYEILDDIQQVDTARPLPSLPAQQAFDTVKQMAAAAPNIEAVKASADAQRAYAAQPGEMNATAETIVLSRYENGFGACKIKVLNILASPEKFTRAQLIEKIQNLTP